MNLLDTTGWDVLREVIDVLKGPITVLLMGLATYYLSKITKGQAMATSAAQTASDAAHTASEHAHGAADLVLQAIADIKASSEGRDEKLEHIRVLVNGHRHDALALIARLQAQLVALGAVPVD